ncbi:MAG: DUF4097 family beta strand repeat-containing protein, partial [Eubacteriales bacterium]|nr:DUF4097 family beta strand repeat-containing protein [Eubacteriales bacterium]
STTKKVVLILTGIVLVCVIGAGIVLGAYFGGGNDLSSFFNLFGENNITVDESESLDLDGVSDIVVACTSGDILIAEGDQARAELKGTVLAREEQDKYLSVSEKDSVLTVRFDIVPVFGNVIMSDIKMTVYLPRELLIDMQINCASGDIAMRGVRYGDVKISNASGNVDITGCEGGDMDIDISSGNIKISDAVFDIIGIIGRSGNINVENTEGDLGVQNTSGDVNVIATYGTLDISVTSGSVTVDLSGEEVAAMDIGVTSGNAILFLDHDAAFDLTAKTISGNTDTDFDILVSGVPDSSPAGDSISGQVNGGGGMVSITVTSGNIYINEK